VDAGLILKPPDERVEVLRFLLHSRVGFPNTYKSCSVKCLRIELFFIHFYPS
jgi:hypothetical protein